MIEISTPKPTSLTQRLARSALRALSWNLDINLPENPKFIVIGAPHTSNMDFIYMLLFIYATGLKLHWIGKHTLFNAPFGTLMRRLGGIPVDRRSQNNFVTKIVDVINQHEAYILAISPEGTRSKSKYWRSGFYYIALGAGIPVALGYIDYKQKVIGIGPSFYPSGDIHADFVQLQHFYAGKVGKHPHLQGPLMLRPEVTPPMNSQ